MGPHSISKSMAAASQGMNAQAYRLQVASENLDVSLDRSDGNIIFEPNHPLADAEGYVQMSNVDMMIELADAREAGRSYEANLSTFKQATQMYSSLLSLLRR